MTTRPKRPGPSVQKVPAVSEVPVTRNMLMGVRDELVARLDQHDQQFRAIDARFNQIDARLVEAEAKNEAFRAEIRAKVARIETLTEEQEARNRIVLEVVQGHHGRFERIEARLDAHEDMLREILAAVTKRR